MVDGQVGQTATALNGQSTDRVILHGSTPAELEPIITEYRNVHPEQTKSIRSDAWAPVGG